MKHNYLNFFTASCRMYYSAILTLIVFIITGNSALSQKIDTSFKPDLYANVTNGEIKVSALQADGKVFIGGNFSSVNLSKRKNLALLNPDGSLDISFDTGESFNFLANNNSVKAIAVQADGKLLVGGVRGKLMRFNPDGSIDESFKVTYPFDFDFNNRVETITIQQDGAILVGGYFNRGSSIPAEFLVRLHADGSVDESFITPFKRNFGFNYSLGGVLSVIEQPDGKLVVGGLTLEAVNDNGVTIKACAYRLHANGKLDISFQTGTDQSIKQLALQPDGKIIGSGDKLSRFNTDGTKDISFSHAITDNLTAMALQKDGNILLGLSSSGGVYKVVRLFPNGDPDESFNAAIKVNSFVNTIKVDQNDKIFIGGNFTEVNGSKQQGIARLEANGASDITFDAGEGLAASIRVWASAVQPDGKIIIGGNFNSVDGISINNIARLNPDGTLDNTFSVGTGIKGQIMSAVRAIVIQPDGKILVGGDIFSYDGVDRRGLLRLNTDGSLDVDFNPQLATVTSPTYAIALQADGKIVVGGLYNSGFNNNRYIFRLNQDGTKDESFISDNGTNNTVMSLAIQSDGKILMGGVFTMVGGVSRTRFARLNADGSLDSDFVPEAVPLSSASTFAPLLNGGILLSNFMLLDGSVRGPLVRLTGSGKIEKINNQTMGEVYGISIQPGGQILVTGNFSISGGTNYGLTRFNEDLTLDETFDGFGRTIKPNYSRAFQSVGKLVLGGHTSYTGVSRHNVLQRVALPVMQSITFPSISSKTYGDAPFELTASSSSDLPVTYELISGPAVLTGNSLTITETGTISVRALQAGNIDFEAANAVEQSFTVAKRQLSVIADAKTKVYGEANPELTYSIAGFAGTEGKEILDELPSITTDATPASNAGEYNITLAGGSDNNYSFTYQAAKLSIAKATATITLSNLEQQHDGSPKAVTAVTTPAGLNVVLTYNGSETAPVESGTYTVVATINDVNYTGTTTATLNVQAPTGIADLERELKEVVAYPNPLKDGFLYLDMGTVVVKGALLVEVYTNKGQLLRSTKMYGSGTKKVDLSGYNSGLYLVRITNGTSVRTVKIHKQ